MGFTREPRTRHIVFDDDHPYFGGLDMRVGGITVNEWLTFNNQDAAEAFIDRLVKWNWEHPTTDEPIPCTPEGIGELDSADVRTLVREWMEQVTGVYDRAPLSSGVGAVNTAFESSIGMQSNGAEVEPLPSGDSS